MLVIPSIDLRGGRTVRLLHGDYALETVYDADPVETAMGFQTAGAQFIHVVDLDGAKSGVIQNWEILEQICYAVDVAVEVGGGVRSLDTAKALLDRGVARVVFGTALVRDPALARSAFQELGEQAVAGIDAREGKVALAGWTDQSEVDALELAVRMQEEGCRRIILTDISRDGALSGPNVDMQERFVRSSKMAVIASGGVTTLEDLRRLKAVGVEGAIIGRAIYEGKLTVEQAIEAAG